MRGKNYPAKNCGVHCNLTHDKTYFILYFLTCLYLCFGLMITTESSNPFAFASDEEMLVFVSIFALSVKVLPGVLFCCVEHAESEILIKTKTGSNFSMAAFVLTK